MTHKIIFKTISFSFILLLIIACGNNKTETTEEKMEEDQPMTEQSSDEVHGTEIKPGEVEMTHPLNQEWVATGKNIYDLKCHPVINLQKKG